jgi:hypothetical protein
MQEVLVQLVEPIEEKVAVEQEMLLELKILEVAEDLMQTLVVQVLL